MDVNSFPAPYRLNDILAETLPYYTMLPIKQPMGLDIVSNPL